jgi:hypothetical protein
MFFFRTNNLYLNTCRTYFKRLLRNNLYSNTFRTYFKHLVRNNLYSNKCFRTILNVFRTIGWGTITYPNGAKVKEGETCTQAEADRYLEYQVEFFLSEMVKCSKNDFLIQA